MVAFVAQALIWRDPTAIAMAIVAAAFIILYVALVGPRPSTMLNTGALLIGPEGVVLGRYQARWDEISSIAKKPETWGRFGADREAFILKEPKPVSRAINPYGSYQAIPLEGIRPKWREEAVLHDIQRWAPHLLSR